ncbi:hypothetical protein ACWGI9_11320 [Streptomyces sp. NPDC054833]
MRFSIRPRYTAEHGLVDAGALPVSGVCGSGEEYMAGAGRSTPTVQDSPPSDAVTLADGVSGLLHPRHSTPLLAMRPP